MGKIERFAGRFHRVTQDNDEGERRRSNKVKTNREKQDIGLGWLDG